ncbi:hypothetical protein DFH08DRAFT_800216 [Mycena albidolilacea]|uniref:Uncharacterized protein n=1 Tax=Mycena albidolilacea TaxID=1033008 RepID=A0AAD7EZS4_9AGAR|nr:hypothetical protein DFH08DRAFT_800216 [Mycena albidolilacea]
MPRRATASPKSVPPTTMPKSSGKQTEEEPEELEGREDGSGEDEEQEEQDNHEEDEDEEEDEENEDEEDEEGDEEEEDVHPRKRRKKSESKSKPKQSIDVNISVFTLKELAKKPKARMDLASGIMKVVSTDLQHRFERKLRAKITVLLALPVPLDDNDDIRILFQVPWHVTNYVLLDDDSYSSMIQAALKCRDPTINIAAGVPKEINDTSDNIEPPKKAKTNGKKSKISTENDISPINAGINAKIGLLRAKYTCHANDGSDYCWVSGEDKKHIPLGNPHFNLWAAAWAQGTADENSPPNHAIFSGNGNSGLAPQSILQRRIAANQSVASNSAPTINNHFSFPDALMDLLRPAPASAAAVPPATPTTQTHDGQMLLPPTMNVGIAMSIDVFCATYDLDPSITDKLATNGYKKASAFRFIELKDLVSIQFLPGEIAELRQAVREWASPG